MRIRLGICGASFAVLALLTASTAQPPPTAAPTPAAPTTTPVVPKERVWPKDVGGKDLKGWLAELKDSPDGAMREGAIKAIPEFGPSVRKEVLQPLINALRKETDPGVKVNLLMLLGSIGPETPEEGKKVVEQLKLIAFTSPTGSPYRLHAVRGLTNCAEYAGEAIPELSKAIDDTAWETRRTVAHAIGIIAKPTAKRKFPIKQGLDTIKDRLKLEKSAPVRLELVQALVVLGPPGFTVESDYPKVVAPYYNLVVDMMKDEKDKAVLVWLNMLLMLYDGSKLNDTTIKKIADFIPGEDASARYAALRALGLLDERSKPFLPNITNALNNPDPFTVVEAINCLAAMDVHAKAALPDLEKLKAATKDETIKDMVAQAIDIIQGKKPPAAVPVPMKK